MLTWEVLVSYNVSKKLHQVIITRQCLQKFLHHLRVIERWRNRWQIFLDPPPGEEHVVLFNGAEDLPGSDTCRTGTHACEKHVRKLVNYVYTYVRTYVFVHTLALFCCCYVITSVYEMCMYTHTNL